MKLGIEVDLGPGHIVLDGDPSPPKGHSYPTFGPCLLWPNGWMDQDATWYGRRFWTRRHCVRWGPSSPLKGAHPPIFGPCLLWPNGRPSQLLLSSCPPKSWGTGGWATQNVGCLVLQQLAHRRICDIFSMRLLILVAKTASCGFSAIS